MTDRNRVFAISGFFSLLFLILIIRLFQLQVVNANNHSVSSSVAVVEEQVIPSRGLIYDRKNRLIVYNAPVYDIYMTLRQFKNADTLALLNYLDINRDYLTKKIDEARSKKFFVKPYPLLKGLSDQDYAKIQEDLYRYPYLSVKISTERRYKYPHAPLVLGYLGEVDQADIDLSQKYYVPGDVIGKTGIEKSFEDSLRGTKGKQFLLRDKSNVVVGKYKEGAFDVPAIAGADLKTTLDIQLQAYAEQLMNGKVGSLVAIEPETGDILTMVSSPTFNPNWLSGRQRSDYFKALLVDSLKPMFNRAVSAEYPPGSTFKPLASLIALQTGSVTEHFAYPCAHGYSRNRGKPGCHSHSMITNVQDAIKQSCNAYYAENFRRTMVNSRYPSIREALDDWRRYMHFFGYDRTFDIGIGGVHKGLFPSSNFYDNIYKGWDWGPMTIISLSIGQGETLATTLQMAQSVSVIANRGNVKEPHLVKDIGDQHIESKVVQVPIEQQYFNMVVDGMEKTFTEGTARASLIDSIAACGKTGTAENFAMIEGKRVQLKDHSLFVAFAPKEKPKIALAVIIENGGFGSTYAAPIASLIIEKYLKDSIPERRQWIEKRMVEANLIGIDNQGDNYIASVEAQQRRAEIRKRVLDSLNKIQ